MEIEYTLSIIKPDITSKNMIGEIYSRFEKNGLKITAAKMTLLSREEAKKFYDEHKDSEFFESLINFMTSNPILVQVLSGKNAIIKYRKLIFSSTFKDQKLRWAVWKP